MYVLYNCKNELATNLSPKLSSLIVILLFLGINLTHLAYHLLGDGSAKTHVYNISKSSPSMRTFHQFYSYLYVEFDKFWVNAKPNDIMDFSFIRDRFEKEIRESLKNPKTVFRINVAVDKI